MKKMPTTKVRATPEVALFIAEGLDPKPFLDKHFSGDWREINAAERARNISSLESGTGHVLSVHTLQPGNITLWITTKEDMTIMMLPVIDNF